MATEQMFTSLPTVGSSQMTDIICAVQGYVSSPLNLGLSTQQTLQQVYNLFQSNVILSYPGNPNGNLAGTTYQLCWDTVDEVLWVCTTSGTSSTAVWTECINPPSSGLTLTGFQTFTTAASGTYTPTAGTVAILVEITAGGGGGGGVAAASSSVAAAGGGGSGSYQRKFYSSIGSSYSYTVGAGGAGGTAGANNGSSGGGSIFDVMSAGGGAGGDGTAAVAITGAAFAQGGIGGNNPGTADIYGFGGPGSNGAMILTAYAGGYGANSYWGGGGRGLVQTAGDGAQTNCYGAGGGGATAGQGGSDAEGGRGGPGIVIVWEFS